MARKDNKLPAKVDEAAPSSGIAELAGGEAWRGDEHALRLEAAREAGLETNDVELEFFTEGFKAGMVLDDPQDRAIVLCGRTVLKEKQMGKALRPTLRFLVIPKDQVALRIHDGEFELRVSRVAAESAKPALDTAKVVLQLWLGAGLVGFAAWMMFDLQWVAAIVWGLALVVGGFTLRRGTVSGRAMLGARLTVALAMLASEEKLILPPARVASGAES